MGSIFKAEGKALAVRETDVKLYYYFHHNKVLEFQKNGLLKPDQLRAYTQILLIHSGKCLPIPIVQGSHGVWKDLFGFDVPKSSKIKKRKLNKWHLKVKN